jgi:hypothetical protein
MLNRYMNFQLYLFHLEEILGRYNYVFVYYIDLNQLKGVIGLIK